jgi:glyoxylase-like metal-dependent hydrolase (beta-lactamase superfamily II)/predicted DCC family thiol-disulfide oxidoreductase YuxK
VDVPRLVYDAPSAWGMNQPAVITDSTPVNAQSSRAGKVLVLYDGQCEICQGCVSWLNTLDRSHKTVAVPIPADVSGIDPRLDLEACLRQLHVLSPKGDIYIGWGAVAYLARLFRVTWLVGALGSVFPFRQLGRLAYGFVAANRYSLSKCRGGSCQVAKPQAVKRRARLGAFWSCYSLGFLIRAPLVLWAGLADAAHRLRIFFRTYRKRLDLLDGKLTILFLNGPLPNAVPLLFGELFTTIIYDGVAIDPGSPKMRSSLARHLRRLKPELTAVVATHAHEEHVGNLNWLSQQSGVPLYVSQMTAAFLIPFKKLPWVRALIIGQPPDLLPPFKILGDRLPTRSGELQVIATPGHCDDHVVLYDAKEKLLLAGDAFMGSYFSTPNPDVDSRKWLDTLQRLLQLDIEILVEGHGHIHTLRPDIPDFPGVVVREEPKAALAEKLAYMQWLRDQVMAGIEENLPVRAIEATCFPWGQRTSWETCANDECIRLLSLGHFSRTELVRSFVRPNNSPLPTVYELRIHGDEDVKP